MAAPPHSVLKLHLCARSPKGTPQCVLDLSTSGDERMLAFVLRHGLPQETVSALADRARITPTRDAYHTGGDVYQDMLTPQGTISCGPTRPASTKSWELKPQHREFLCGVARDLCTSIQALPQVYVLPARPPARRTVPHSP